MAQCEIESQTNYSCISHLNNLNLRIRLTHIRETFESAYGKHKITE